MINSLNKIKASIIDKNFIKTIKNETLGKSMMYLFVFMVIIGCSIMTKKSIEINNLANESIISLKKEVADFEIKDGKFVYYGEMPLIIENNQTGIIIDTTGKTNSEILKKYESGFIINETEAIYKKNALEISTYKLGELKGNDFTKAELIDVLQVFILPVIAVVFIMGIIFIYIAKLIGVLFLTIIGEVLNLTFKTKMDYKTILKICIYAITVPTLMNWFIKMFEIKIPYFYTAYYAVAIIYIIKYLKNGQNSIE